MSEAAHGNGAATRATPRPIVSPLVDEFRLSPFRALRLSVDASADDALWKAEKIRTLERVGVAPPEPDPLGWLPPADALELQRMVHTLEEPLRRLQAQLLWFDFERDPRPDELLRLLGRPFSPALIDELDRQPPSGDEENGAGIARRLNQANACLLFGAAALHGIGSSGPPAADTGDGTAGPDESPAPSLRWESKNGQSVATNPHHALHTGDGAGPGAALLEAGITRWTALLGDRAFEDYLAARAAALDDERLDEGDVETVGRAVRVRLADLVGAEMKRAGVDGRLDRLGALLRAASRAGLDRQTLAPVLRPLRQMFEADIRALEPLLGDRDAVQWDDVETYLTRIASLGRAWTAIDPDDLIGVSRPIDAAAERVAERVNGADPPPPPTKARAILRQAGVVALSPSVKKRLQSGAGDVGDEDPTSCYYCGGRSPDPDYFVVLKGKKETGRQESYNQTTIYYSITYDFVPRCERCWRVHEFGFSISRWCGVAALPALLFALFAIVGPGLGMRGFWAWAVGCAVVIAGAVLVGAIGRSAAAAALAPAGGHSHSDTASSAGARRLRRQGFGIENKDYTRGALERVARK